MPGNPRIKDIADRLGVSLATVSRALNDKPGVAAELRRRVLEVAAEMDFTPNMAARSLSRAHTGAVAFVVHQQAFPVASDPFYFLIMRGVERALTQEGYHVMLATVGDRNEQQAEDLRVVREHRVDGLILAGPDIEAGLVLSVVERGLPLVLVDNALQGTSLDAVLCDDCQGARAAVEHLLSHGYQRLAFVGGPRAWLSTRERCAGYEEALRAAGLELQILHEEVTTMASGLQAGRKLFASPPYPQAVFAVNDAMAMGVIRAAREAGRRVPDDLAVAGFDDVSLAESNDPPLTTVHVPKELMGKLAARRLVELIKGEQPVPIRIIASARLVVRESCGCQPP